MMCPSLAKGNVLEFEDGPAPLTDPPGFAIHEIETIKGTARWVLDEAEKLLGRKGRILELGCGRGIVLQEAAKRGWEVRGVEMTEQFAREADGVDIEVSSVEDCMSLSEKYDIVLLFAILEHVYEPVELLKRCNAALNHEGLLFIDVPNEASLTLKVGNLYSRPWSVNLSPTFAPYHVVGFSPQSLSKALEMSGFGVEKRYNGARSWMSHHLELPDSSIGEVHSIDIERNNATGIHPARLSSHSSTGSRMSSGASASASTGALMTSGFPTTTI